MHNHDNSGLSRKTQYITLAIEAINSNASESIRAASRDYHVPFSTVLDRLNGRLPRAEAPPNGKKLTKLEEAAIVKRILDLDSRGFPPTKAILRDMANKLLAEREAGTVGINWPDRFIARQEGLKTCYTRAYDRQRALCEDAAAIKPWFELVRLTKEKYGIPDDDTYNFDETGFMIGMITS